jgi:hypothetical protein
MTDIDGLLRNEPARERMALIWRRRAVSEHEATARFAAYAERLKDFEVPGRFQDETFQASEQELVHREVCLDMAHRLRAGEITFAPQDFTLRVPAGPANMLADMVALCCIVETLNVAAISTSLREIKDREMRQATRKILADEVKHSRLGWAYLAWARTKGEGELLAPHIPQMLWEAISPDLFTDPTPHPEQALLTEMGDPAMPARRALVLETINEVILPGLEANGIDTGPARAWLQRPTWPWVKASG